MPISDTCSKDKQVLCRRGRYEQLSTTPKQMSVLRFWNYRKQQTDLQSSPSGDNDGANVEKLEYEEGSLSCAEI